MFPRRKKAGRAGGVLGRDWAPGVRRAWGQARGKRVNRPLVRLVVSHCAGRVGVRESLVAVDC